MKTRSAFTSIFAIALVAMLSLSCASDSPTNPGTTSDGTFTFSKSGALTGATNFSSFTVASFSTEGDETFIAGSTVAITSGASVANLAVLTVPGKTTGTWSFDDNAAMAMFFSSSPYIATSGTITITEYGAVGGRIKGTFSGTTVNPIGSSTVEITSGVFNIKREADDVYKN